MVLHFFFANNKAWAHFLTSVIMIYNLNFLYIFSKNESPEADTKWFPEADHWETSGGEAELWCRLQR